MRLEKLSPILWTRDLNATVSFYTTVLGFTTKGNFPNFATLTRDGVEIMFVVPEDEPGDCKDTAEDHDFFPRPILTGSIYITMDEVDRLWKLVKDHAAIKTSLADRDYMKGDFSILDNNGYELVFGKDIVGSN